MSLSDYVLAFAIRWCGLEAARLKSQEFVYLFDCRITSFCFCKTNSWAFGRKSRMLGRGSGIALRCSAVDVRKKVNLKLQPGLISFVGGAVKNTRCDRYGWWLGTFSEF